MSEATLTQVLMMFGAVEVTLMMMWRRMVTKEDMRARFARHINRHHDNDAE